MISKIIQKEKERQKYYIANRFYGAMAQQKQSLINLKEYLEGEYKKIMREINSYKKCYCADCSTKIHKFLKFKNKEDIEELTKMIEAYE